MEKRGHGSWRRREVPWGRGSQRPEWLPRLAPRRRGEGGAAARGGRSAAEVGLAAKEAGAEGPRLVALGEKGGRRTERRGEAKGEDAGRGEDGRGWLSS